MKIRSIRTRNILGARDISVVIRSAVSVFCGFNAAGKSSLAESLRLAFQGETIRVKHKQDYPLMVSDGAKEGFVKVLADEQTYEYRLPSGEHMRPEAGVPDVQLNSVLNAQRFASMTPDERRAFLTVLTKAKPSSAKMHQLLEEAGVEQFRRDLAIPMLKSGPGYAGGFPAACEIAKQKATEAKGAWKAITGGVWGSLKGETWSAPEVDAPTEEDLAMATELLENTTADLSAASQALGGLNEKVKAARQRLTEIESITNRAGGLQRAKEKLERDLVELDRLNVELDDLNARAGTGPKHGLVHDMAGFITTLDFTGSPEAQVKAAGLIESYEVEFGPVGEEGDADALAKIPTVRQTRDTMKRAVDNARREVADAEAAAELLDSMGAAEPVDHNALETIKAQVAAAEQAQNDARTALNKLQALDKAAKERDTKTANAQELHKDVVGWLKVAEQFAPDGIPAQILATALEPLNKLFRAAAIATDWRQIVIRPDMEITAGGRLYSLHSVSERWMIDAMIAGVISQYSGLNLLVLDGFDVLDINHRPALIYWLSELGDQGMQVLVFGTLKEPPKGMPENVSAIWITRGENEQTELLAA